MKIITIKQPFATLVAEGLKEFEFRSWKTNYRGEILIHAGKGIDSQAMKRYQELELDYPSGCIIAKAIITDCIIVDEELKKVLKQKNEKIYHGVIKKDISWEGYGFKLENVQKIVPIPVKGKLGLWDYEYEGK